MGRSGRMFALYLGRVVSCWEACWSAVTSTIKQLLKEAVKIPPVLLAGHQWSRIRSMTGYLLALSRVHLPASYSGVFGSGCTTLCKRTLW
ncbi:hypothetical protein BDW75DRAFT_79507 [Aspergillus navahoensis]